MGFGQLCGSLKKSMGVHSPQPQLKEGLAVVFSLDGALLLPSSLTTRPPVPELSVVCVCTEVVESGVGEVEMSLWRVEASS